MAIEKLNRAAREAQPTVINIALRFETTGLYLGWVPIRSGDLDVFLAYGHS
jgi:hypothetical protein